MSTTDTKVDELIINTLTKAQYDSLVANNQVEANQLYLTKDEDYYTQMAVTYGTTTYAQITSALTAKQEPVCNYNSYQYTYAGNDGTYYYFTCAINSEIKYVRVSSSNVWTNGTASLQTTISDINTIRANASLGATAVQPSDLATVATTGSYTDLSNKPTIPTVNNASLVIQKNSSNVATFTANASANVTCNITVPTKVSDLNNDSGFITGITASNVTTALGYTPYNSTNPNGYITGITANNVTTALGYTPYNSTNPNGYTSNTGTVTSVRVQAGTGLSSSTSTAQNTTLNTTISIASGYKLPTTTEWSGKQDALPAQSGHSGKFLTTDGSTLSWATVSTGTSDYSSLTNKPSINSVTLSGNKTSSDLGLQPALATQTVYSAKGSATKVPQITTNNLGQVTSITEVTITQPTVNNATLTIQKNGTTVSSFTSNASSNVTCNITVPTKVSDLNNDSGFITGITANNVTTALGYTPYNSSNPSGYTSNTGTVTSVRVQAGTGLSSSTSTAQNTTLNTTISIASGYKLPTTTEWNNKQDALATQTAYTSKGSATKVPQITTNTLGQVTGITEVTITQPTVNNKTITIQKNSTTVDSFTLNQSTDKTINITVPTTASDVGAVASNTAITGATKCKITYDSKGLVTSGSDLQASDIPDLSSTYLTSHQSIKTLKTDNTSAQSTSSSETITGSGTINLHKVSKTGSYNDLNNKPTIPTVNNATITIQKNSSTVDSFTLNQSSNKSINIDVPTDAGSINGITILYNGWFSNPIEEGVKYGDGLNKGFFTSFNLLHGVQDNFYLANKGLRNGTPAIISCNYYDPYGYDFVNGEFGRYDTNVNPSTAFSTTPFVWEIKCPTSFEWTDVCRLFIVGHRIYTPFYVTKYKIEVAYAYSSGTYSWGTVVDYNGTSVDITRKYYDLVTSASGQSYHEIYGVRLTISESSETVFTLAEFMLLCSRGSEKKSESMNSLDLGGGKVVGNITIPTNYGSFVGNLNGNASSADGVKDTRSSNTIKTWTGTRAQYDAIVTKDANTLYNITDDTDTTAAMLELLYPVGAVYIGTMDVCPLAALGIGSWEKIAEDQVLQGSSSNHNAGATIAAGLPNITGSLYSVYTSNRPNEGGESATGAFGIGSSTNVSRDGGGSASDAEYGFNFDASRSSSIYGNSNTVQPPAFVVNIWRRVS